MAWLYILKSDKNGRYYVGSTNCINRRIEEHNRGQTPSTAPYRPFTVAYSLETATLKKARNLERKIKNMKSRIIIEKIVNEQKIIN